MSLVNEPSDVALEQRLRFLLQLIFHKAENVF